jgi:hypothetical protein
MPLFDFHSLPSESITTPRFWIFWASTVPLTLFVLVIYALYLLYINRKHEREDAASASASNTDANSTPGSMEKKENSKGLFKWKGKAKVAPPPNSRGPNRGILDPDNPRNPSEVFDV